MEECRPRHPNPQARQGRVREFAIANREPMPATVLSRSSVTTASASWLSPVAGFFTKRYTNRSKHRGTAIVPTTSATAFRCNSARDVSRNMNKNLLQPRTCADASSFSILGPVPCICRVVNRRFLPYSMKDDVPCMSFVVKLIGGGIIEYISLERFLRPLDFNPEIWYAVHTRKWWRRSTENLH